jgi:DNA-binding winged helix-turn-helix (wHTH) protein
LVQRRELLAGNRPVELGGRAFELLIALIEARDAVVSKHALIEYGWPDRIVKENNLQAQISALRSLFGPDRELIRPIAGQGYQFAGAIPTVPESPHVSVTAGVARQATMPRYPQTNLREPVFELINRDAEPGEILDLSAAHRLVILTGVSIAGRLRDLAVQDSGLRISQGAGVGAASSSALPGDAPPALILRWLNA